MNKEVLSAGMPYLWGLYYAVFILCILIYLSGFRFLPAGIVFLVMLLMKCYAGNKLIMNLVYCYKYKNKAVLYKKQIRLNGTIAGTLLLKDIALLIHVPEVFKQTYTFPALMIFILVSVYCILYQWNNPSATYTPETTAREIVFQQKK